MLAPRPSPGWRNGVPPQHNHCRLGTDPLGLFNWFNGQCPPSSILINLASVLWHLNHATFNFRAYDFMLIHLQLNNGEQIHTLTSQASSFLGVLVSGIKGVLDVSSGMQAISNVRGKGDHRGLTLPVSLFAETTDWKFQCVQIVFKSQLATFPVLLRTVIVSNWARLHYISPRDPNSPC